MAGGTWTSQTKVRPGAYINFKAVDRNPMRVGDRGVIAIGLPLNWGERDALIEVLSSDFLDGNSKKLIGVSAGYGDGDNARLLRGALTYCYKALVYRTNAGGSKAGGSIGKLSCVAKYYGTFPNNYISVVVTKSGAVYTVTTYAGSGIVDVQKVLAISELKTNDYVVFSEGVSGSFEAGTTTLTGGNDGTVTEATAYESMFALLEMANWQTFACVSTTVTSGGAVPNTVAFIKRLRDEEGRYVQGVVANYDADDEGIINNVCGAVIDGVQWTAAEFCAIVAGMTAGANFNESNTAKVIEGASAIVNQLTDSQIKEALGQGKFVLSTSADGRIKVEQDINSLHTYGEDRSYTFSKNRVMRVLDEIGTTVRVTWESSYMGKVDNNENGRSLFRSDLIVYLRELERLNGIQNFDIDDVVVTQGDDIDSVLVTLAIMPVDSMEKLYMIINVSS